MSRLTKIGGEKKGAVGRYFVQHGTFLSINLRGETLTFVALQFMNVHSGYI
jgi:hypothetical protein